MSDDDTPEYDDRPYIWGQPEDYVNMRMLVDAAEHGKDHTALGRIREYVDALEAVGNMRATARNTLPIAPFRMVDVLPAFQAARGGISLFGRGDWSDDAARIKARHDAVVALFREINRFQWSKQLRDVTVDDLDYLAGFISGTRQILEANPLPEPR